MAAFDDLLTKLRVSAMDYRTMGDKFERLMVEYFKKDPLYKGIFKNVWMWSDFPYNGGKVDTGIDIVAEDIETGKYCAIQCKFYNEEYILQKKDIDSFFTASGKSIYSSRIIVTTTDKWSKHAEDALNDQTIPVTRLRLADLSKSAIDWKKFSLSKPADMKLAKQKQLRPHQQEALTKVMTGFGTEDRGKLIMACGTGKTFTSLKIAEDFANQKQDHTFILYLVPSISLLSQTLREWNNDTQIQFNTFAVCSDKKVTKQSEDITAVDIGFPATTNPQHLVQQFANRNTEKKMTVIFSTYHSIEVISKAQEKGLVKFDLIISDEAHRTTGVTLTGEDESHFTRVHNNNFIKSNKRLYQTATPKIFGDETKSKATDHNAILCSMDDEVIFGKEFHYLGFGEAVSLGLLTDYKVMVLAVSEDYVHKAFVNEIKDDDNALRLSDVVKITGCWNGLSKRKSHSDEKFGLPMKRAVAFSKSIKDSKLITDMFAHIVDEHIRLNNEEDGLVCEVEHVDGTFNALERNKKIDWLKEETPENTCRILSNARCLTEGVDVPDLDAVIFLNPRNSVVDVVQAVGRVMRQSETKEYGYIILPIGIPADISAEEALNDNKKYKVVWQVLQALRAHDERFNTLVNQIELNKKKPDKINVIGIGGGEGKGGDTEGAGSSQVAFNFPDLEDLRDAVYAKLVDKVGDRRYWENWANDVAEIAKRHIEHLNIVLEKADQNKKQHFQKFVKELQMNLNESIDEAQAIEMLSQHLITKPVFDALFDNYAFTKNNPISIAIETVIELLEVRQLENETHSLSKFYASVRERAKGIDNSAGKQKIIIELYDKFFKIAFSKTTERLGIVYTPVEVVDFIINSTNDILMDEFGLSIGKENVHILDPFTGTGTFITRLIHSNLMTKDQLIRKYRKELHANEIILLAYYIASINIEEAYHEKSGNNYEAFEGIILTDTFEMYGKELSLDQELFPENNLRHSKQINQKITVIIGNPPYSAKQDSMNENNQNQKYPQLDNRIRDTYAFDTNATNKNNLYDSYIRAIRWATDRIEENGVVCFVTNNSFIDGNAMDGMRKHLQNDFTTIYCYNMLGHQYTQGEKSRQEGGKIFGSGSRTGISINFFVKNSKKVQSFKLNYAQVPYFQTREEKLESLKQQSSIKQVSWTEIEPNDSYDWINQREENFVELIPIGVKSKDAGVPIFDLYSRGLETSRDTWVYNYSKQKLLINVSNMIITFNNEVDAFLERTIQGMSIEDALQLVNNDSLKIKWSSSLLTRLRQGKKIIFNDSLLREVMYRPYFKQWVYFEDALIHRMGQVNKIYPESSSENLVIYVSGSSSNKEMSAFMVKVIPDLNLNHSGGQGFPLYVYESNNIGGLFEEEESLTRKYNINSETMELFKDRYGNHVTEETIFYYVYAILNHPGYKVKFENSLQKMLPRIPLLDNIELISKYGEKLANIHLEIDIEQPYPVKENWKGTVKSYEIKKAKFPKVNKKDDLTSIIINEYLTITDIPEQAYYYKVNGRSLIEWYLDQHYPRVDISTQIAKSAVDFNNDSFELYINLKKIITVSIRTHNLLCRLEEECKI